MNTIICLNCKLEQTKLTATVVRWWLVVFDHPVRLIGSRICLSGGILLHCWRSGSYPLDQALSLWRGRPPHRLLGVNRVPEVLQRGGAHDDGHWEVRVVVEVTRLQLHLQRVVQKDDVVGVQGGSGSVHGHTDAGLVLPLGQAQGAVRDQLLDQCLGVEVPLHGLSRQEDEVLLDGHLHADDVVVWRLVVHLQPVGYLLKGRESGGGQGQGGADGSRNAGPMAEILQILVLDR